jgi:hypothetical protein
MSRAMFPGMSAEEQETGKPPEGVLPGSSKMVGNELVGIKDSGYIEKKGTPSGLDARFNFLPPGMEIEDQKNTDIRPQKMCEYKGGISYPGDGWT